jgi:outer membrane protein OmpA-like peptidoglycan-associated protein
MAGHADPRGTDSHNDLLSARRAKALEMFLKSKGLQADVVPLGYGAHCPVEFSSALYSIEEQYRILRRVEVMPGNQLTPGYCHGKAPFSG